MKNKCMFYIVLQVLKLQSSGVKTATNNKPSFYTPAITPRDEINMLVDRGYFREPSLKMVSVHSN